jgi:DNA integrity scanning protein DisA with diadenylate cyclase activity
MALFASDRLVAVRQSSIWRIVATSAFTAQLKAAIAEILPGRGAASDKSPVNWITMAALTMNYRRSGALLVVVPDRIPETLVSGRVQSRLEDAYQRLLVGRNVRSASSSLLLNAMTLDGATFISPHGIILGFGQIIDGAANVAASEGARSRAAAAASMHGVAVKISADGPIAMYCRGVEVGALLPRPKTPSLQMQPLF